MNEYARASGRSVSAPVQAVERPLPPLTREEEAKAAAARDFVRTHMPELLPVIKDLVQEGLIPGWRAVVGCTLINEEK